MARVALPADEGIYLIEEEGAWELVSSVAVKLNQVLVGGPHVWWISRRLQDDLLQMCVDRNMHEAVVGLEPLA